METRMTTAREMREQLVAKATEDETFRARLLSDPKAAVSEELGVSIPPGYTLKVHEEAVDTSHLVLPPSGTLGEADLAEVSGGRNKPANDELATFWDDW